MRKKRLTFTNVFVISCVVVYVLNVFIVFPSTGFTAKAIIESFYKLTGRGPADFQIIMYKLLGTWGGNVNDILGFKMSNFLHGELWRPFTSLLPHGHIFHLIMNMLALYILGNKLEERYGIIKTSLIFIFVGAINCILSSVLYFNLLGNAEDIVTGASSGILVLLGMLFIICCYNKDYFKNSIKKIEIIYLTIYFVFTTFLTGSLATLIFHLLGLLLGVLVELFMYNKIDKRITIDNR